MTDHQRKLIKLFYKYVDILPNGCHFWTGARSRGKGNKKWYGTFGKWRAHRFADEVIAGRGPLPSGYHRDHTCCFSMCVNPDHIERVTHEENQDRKIKRWPVEGRAAIPFVSIPGWPVREFIIDDLEKSNPQKWLIR